MADQMLTMNADIIEFQEIFEKETLQFTEIIDRVRLRSAQKRLCVNHCATWFIRKHRPEKSHNKLASDHGQILAHMRLTCD